MKIVKMVGNLGNQMFIYAFAKALEHYSGDKVYFDVSWYKGKTLDIEKMFNVNIEKMPKFLNFWSFIFNHKTIFRFLVKYYYRYEFNENNYYSELLEQKGFKYYKSYFQCEKYFKAVENVIRHDFSFKDFDCPELEKLKNEIENYVCPIFINVRRGDYVTLDKQGIRHWLCDMSYYQKAAKIMHDKFPNCTFIAVSDEPEWLKENLDIGYPFKIYSSPLRLYDIYLLKACKHAICANSSYSWWAAWLIDNVDKVVIAPEPWLEPTQPVDTIPDDWIKVPRY